MCREKEMKQLFIQLCVCVCVCVCVVLHQKKDVELIRGVTGKTQSYITNNCSMYTAKRKSVMFSRLCHSFNDL